MKEPRYVLLISVFAISATQNVVSMFTKYKSHGATFSSQNTYFCLCHFIPDLTNNGSESWNSVLLAEI